MSDTRTKDELWNLFEDNILDKLKVEGSAFHKFSFSQKIRKLLEKHNSKNYTPKIPQKKIYMKCSVFENWVRVLLRIFG